MTNKMLIDEMRKVLIEKGLFFECTYDTVHFTEDTLTLFPKIFTKPQLLNILNRLSEIDFNPERHTYEDLEIASVVTFSELYNKNCLTCRPRVIQFKGKTCLVLSVNQIVTTIGETAMITACGNVSLVPKYWGRSIPNATVINRMHDSDNNHATDIQKTTLAASVLSLTVPMYPEVQKADRDIIDEFLTDVSIKTIGIAATSEDFYKYVSNYLDKDYVPIFKNVYNNDRLVENEIRIRGDGYYKAVITLTASRVLLRIRTDDDSWATSVLNIPEWLHCIGITDKIPFSYRLVLIKSYVYTLMTLNKWINLPEGELEYTSYMMLTEVNDEPSTRAVSWSALSFDIENFYKEVWDR